MHISTWMLSAALLGSFAHAADPIPYVPMSFCKTSETDLRAEWDKNRRVCFTARGGVQSLVKIDGKVQSYRLSDMGEIKLRDNGEWQGNAYVAALHESRDPSNVALLKEIASYNKYYVRYLSVSEPVNGVMPFMASVFFSWGMFGHGTQTMYVFGEITKDGVRLTGFSNADGYDGDIRAAYNTIANLLVLFDGENPNKVGVKQTQNEDRARAQGVRAVVKKYSDSVAKKDSDVTIPKN